jgi:hypothetical protein
MNRSKRDALAVGTVAVDVISAIWNFISMFSAWVVASQKDSIGMNILFLFTGVMPIIGVTAGIFRKRWAAWILFAAPLVSSFAFPFLSKIELRVVVLFVAVYFLPVIVAGLGFFYLTRTRQIRGSETVGT